MNLHSFLGGGVAKKTGVDVKAVCIRSRVKSVKPKRVAGKYNSKKATRAEEKGAHG